MSQTEHTTLGQSCEFFNGKAHEKAIDDKGKYIVVNSKFVSTEGKTFKRTNEQLFPLYIGDIVMVMSDVPNGKTLAKCFVIGKDDTYSLNQRICCIRSKDFDTKYLYYQLNRHPHLLAFNNGENQSNLRKDDILACPLMKPSLEEQKRMVEELDQTFAKLNQAKANTLKNLQNAKELFETELRNVFENKGEGWEEKSLGECCEELFAGGDAPKENFSIEKNELNNIPIYANAVKYDGLYGYTNFARVTKPSITIAARGSGTGHTLLRNENYFPIVRVIVVIPKSEIISVDFLKLAIDTLVIVRSGSAIPQLTIPMIKDYKIPFPKSLQTQQEIVAKLDALKTQTQQLESVYQTKLNNIEELYSGILKRAFETQLIEA